MFFAHGFQIIGAVLCTGTDIGRSHPGRNVLQRYKQRVGMRVRPCKFNGVPILFRILMPHLMGGAVIIHNGGNFRRGRIGISQQLGQ